MKTIRILAALIALAITPSVAQESPGSSPQSVRKGGTGISTATAFGILYGNGTSPFGVTGAGSNGQLFIGQTSAAAQFKTVTGDITIDNLGVVAVGANKIANGMLRQSAALSLVGRSANSTGNVADISASAGSSCAFRESGGTIGCGTLATAAYAANSVTNAKLAQMGNSTVKCRVTAGTGDPEDCNAAQVRSVAGLVIGTNVQAWDPDLDAFALKTAPSGAVVGTTDTQTLTNKTLTTPAISSPTGLVKGDVGLGNVDNTSDATKWGATKTLTNTTYNCGSTGNVCTVRFADITGFGTGVSTALGVNVGSAGAFVANGGALGTPSSGVATNLTGTAAGLTAGNVTTNANLTGDVTSVGNATTLTNAPVIAKVLTAFSAAAGAVSSSDSILTAFQKIVGNIALKSDSANGVLTGTTDIQQAVTHSGDITPAQITATQNDYAPSGFSTASVVRVSTDASRDITGLAGGTDGRTIYILNVGSFSAVLKDEGAGSTAANRFGFGADLTLASKQGATLVYDATASRWRQVGGPSASGGGSGTVTSVVCNGGITTITTSGSCQSRESLTSNRTYYVGAELGAATVTLATPGVWSLTAHSLSDDDPIVFSIKPDRATATITAASPAVVTRVAHGFAAGQPIKFLSSGYLPTGIASGTTYYVIASGLTADTFQFSATVGGGAVATTAISSSFSNGSSTITSGSAHGLIVGQMVRFAGSVATNFSAGTDYYVLSAPTSTTFTVSATNGGSAVTAGSAASGGTVVQTGTHYVEKTGALPTGVIAGTIYYARNVTANTFEFAATAGGASIATSGSQSGLFTVITGNDANNGLAATRSGAFLSLAKAMSAAAALDAGIYNVTVQLGPGIWTTPISLPNMLGSGAFTLRGDTTYWSNAAIATTSSAVIADNTSSVWTVDGFKVSTSSSGHGLYSSRGARLNYTRIDFGACATAHVAVDTNGSATSVGASIVSAGAPIHWFLASRGLLADAGKTITMLSVPSFGNAFAQVGDLSYAQVNNNSFVGSAVGPRHAVTMNSAIGINGLGSNYLPGNVNGTASTGGQIN